MTSAKTTTFETGHEEMIHDVQLDYYGKRLASCSSDRTIRIFELSGAASSSSSSASTQSQQQTQTLVATLKGHDGPVFQVSWAHPKFGPILASCSYDGRVCVWKETAANVWNKIFEHSKADTSVNSVSWSPHELGLMLTAARSDGTISVFARKDTNEWQQWHVMAHKGSANAVSWAPNPITIQPAQQLQHSQQFQSGLRLDGRFVSAGCDNRIRIWRFDYGVDQWVDNGGTFLGDDSSHADWVRDVAWAPSLGLPSNTIASASEDKTVIIWTEDASGVWKKAKVLPFSHKVWRVSWSVMGNILAVAQGDNKVSLWKEAADGDWKSLSTVAENDAQ